MLGIIEREDVEYYRLHSDYVKMLYLVATVDYISKKYDIPPCDKYDEIRNMKLEKPYFVGDSAFINQGTDRGIEEFAKYNIIEGDRKAYYYIY